MARPMPRLPPVTSATLPERAEAAAMPPFWQRDRERLESRRRVQGSFRLTWSNGALAPMAHPIGTLYVEELKATMRGRFSWLGAGVVLLALGGLATVGTQDTWLDGYGII